MKRKTIKVEQLVEIANQILALSEQSADFRNGVRTILEDVLFKTENYKGFRFLHTGEVAEGERPGINYETNEFRGLVLSENVEDRFVNTDSSRVLYYS